MNALAKDYTTKSLLKYAFPTIIMMIFMSTYTIVDGIFVANLVGEQALSAVNIIVPMINFLLAVGLMLATGGCAIMGKLLGEGKEKEARSFLSLLYVVAVVLGISITCIVFLFPNQLVTLLGSNSELFEHAKDYLFMIGLFSTSFFLQIYVQSFFVLAGKPMLGFVSCFIGGIVNMILDYLLIAPHLGNMGIAGAGLATGLGGCVPAIVGILYFTFYRKESLYFEKPVMNKELLVQAIFNGSSEFVGQLATAITTCLFNILLLKIAGTAGVTAITIILYIQMMQTAVYAGYSMGVAPIISYKYGAQDHKGLQHILEISFKFITLVSIIIIACSLLFDDQAVAIFLPTTSSTFALAKDGLRIFSIAYLFMGINIFVSAMFTALNNGKVSAGLSFTRTFVFLVACLLGLPLLFDITGVWLAVPVAELLTCCLSIYQYKKQKKEYHY